MTIILFKNTFNAIINYIYMTSKINNDYYFI